MPVRPYYLSKNKFKLGAVKLLGTCSRICSKVWKDESGQSTTEYILILSVVVMVALRFRKSFEKIMGKATDNLEKDLDGAFQDSGQ